MKEYDVWFELYGYDGVRWEFLADFDTREQADEYVRTSPIAGDYDRTKISKCKGIA